MSWRVVVISGRCKLEYKLGYLVCRGENQHKVFLNEISTLIIESTAISITTALISRLVELKINVVFCDQKHNPNAQLIPFYGRHNCSGVLRRQFMWTESIKKAVWTEIIRMKIRNQYLFLSELGSAQADLLKAYLDDLQEGDITNREGHAAKVYFNVLFGLSFKRGDQTFFNAALNYGYAILLSAFNREIVACGYLTQLGIAHKNEFNDFNLGCDLIEPFRILVDRAVFCSESEEMTPDYKYTLCNLLNREVKINGKFYTATDAIGIYTKSILNALDERDISLIKGYEL